MEITKNSPSQQSCHTDSYTLRRDGKSAEAIDSTGVVDWPLWEGVRNSVKRKGIDRRRVGLRPSTFRRSSLRTLPTPYFFVSVASKGLSQAVSLLFATLAGKSISVAAKGLMEADCWREGNWVAWEDFEGVRRTQGRASIVSKAPLLLYRS